jgi:hypothetical protein
MGLSKFDQGKKYTGEVVRFSGSNNAIVSIDSGHINLGPINHSAKGEQVEFVYLGRGWGRCIETEHTYDGYDPRDNANQSSEIQDLPTGGDGPPSAIDGNPRTPSENKNNLLNGHQ